MIREKIKSEKQGSDQQSERISLCLALMSVVFKGYI